MKLSTARVMLSAWSSPGSASAPCQPESSRRAICGVYLTLKTITLASKGQLTIPRQLREVLVPSKYEPEDLFWVLPPKVDRVLFIDDMDRAIALVVGGEDA